VEKFVFSAKINSKDWRKSQLLACCCLSTSKWCHYKFYNAVFGEMEH